MINIQYGFETLAHRYYVLCGKSAPTIDIDNRINIASLLNGLYGEKYAQNPHMENLMILNGGELRRDFVAGKEEPKLFEDQEFARLHASTVSKVRFFSDVVELILDGKLKTESATAYVRIERFMDDPLAKTVGFAASIWTIISIGIIVWQLFH